MQNHFENWDGSIQYDWLTNHLPAGEGPMGRSRTLTREASTGLIGGVLQQGDDGELTLKMSGEIWHQSQFVAMWQWYNRSKNETILFRDFTGAEYEVSFTSFLPTRVGLLRNPRDPVNCPGHKWTYDIELTILQIFSGPMAGLVTP